VSAVDTFLTLCNSQRRRRAARCIETTLDSSSHLEKIPAVKLPVSIASAPQMPVELATDRYQQ
jgi:hypothetical protein